MDTRSRVIRVLVPCGILAAIALLIFLGFGGSDASPHQKRGGVTHETPAKRSPMSTAPIVEPLLREVADDNAARIQVVNPQGRAIEGAGIWKSSGDRHPYRYSDPGLLATSGPDGVASVRAESDLWVAIGHRGFVTRRVLCRPNHSETVVLEWNHTVHFVCSEMGTERPLPGVLVAVSTKRLPVPRLGRTWILEYEPRHGADTIPSDTDPILLARTGHDGSVRLTGLSAGFVDWDCRLEGYACTGGPGLDPPDTQGVEFPGGPYRLEFSRFYAAGFRVEGDDLLHSRCTLEGNVQGRGLATLHGPLIAGEIQAEHPDWTVMVMPALDASPLPLYRCELYLARKGRQELTVPLVPLEQFLEQGPHVVRADELETGDIGMVELTLTLENADGTLLPGPGLFLLDPKDGSMQQRLVSGDVAHVPAKHYRVAAEDPTVGRSLPDPCEIDLSRYVSVRSRVPTETLDVEGRETALRLKLQRTLRRISVQGVPGTRGIRLVLPDGVGRMPVVLDREGAEDLYLPVGRFRLEATSEDGTVRELVSFEVGDAAERSIDLREHW